VSGPRQQESDVRDSLCRKGVVIETSLSGQRTEKEGAGESRKPINKGRKDISSDQAAASPDKVRS